MKYYTNVCFVAKLDYSGYVRDTSDVISAWNYFGNSYTTQELLVWQVLNDTTNGTCYVDLAIVYP